MGSDAVVLAGLIAAAVLSACLTPLAARVAQKVGAVSEARSDRWGGQRTPLLGGAAIATSIAVSLFLFATPTASLLIVVACGAGAFGLGLVDDLRALGPNSKLVGQVAIGSALALGGIHAEISGNPAIDYVITLFWVVGMMNALNLVDNMDGLAAGIAAIAASVLMFMAPVEPVWVRVLAAVLAGACIGFLLHNFAPARIYMGDAGSLLLGFLLASLALLLTKSAAANVGLAILGPLVVLGLPIFDTALVAVVRRAEGRPVSVGGRDHVSHRLTAHGLSERAAVIVLYGIAASLAVLGLFATSLDLVFVPIGAVALIALILFGFFLTQPPESVARSPRGRIIRSGHRLLRFGGETALDVVLATIALFSAFLLRFDTLPVAAWIGVFFQAAPIVVTAQLTTFVLSGVYRTLWSHLGITDVVAVVRAIIVGTVSAGVIMFYGLSLVGQSRAVLLIDAAILAILVCGSRLFLVWLRHWFALRPRHGDRRVIIVGASVTGEIALQMLLRAAQNYHPVGFVDDDPGKHRRRIGGVTVLGRIADLADLTRERSVDLIVLAIDDEAVRTDLKRQFAELGPEIREFPRTI